MANLKIKANAYCVIPTLTSVVANSSNSATFTFNPNGMITAGMTIILQGSTDSGTTWTTIETISPTSSPYHSTNSYYSSLTGGTSVKFRVVSNSTRCGLLNSNILTQTWSIPANIFISDQVTDFNGNTSYKLHVEGSAFNGYASSILTATTNIKNCAVDFTGFGYNTGNDLSITAATVGQEITINQAISIPVGIYDATIAMTAVPTITYANYETRSAISFGTSTNYYRNALSTTAKIVAYIG